MSCSPSTATFLDSGILQEQTFGKQRRYSASRRVMSRRDYCGPGARCARPSVPCVAEDNPKRSADKFAAGISRYEMRRHLASTGLGDEEDRTNNFGLVWSPMDFRGL